MTNTHELLNEMLLPKQDRSAKAALSLRLETLDDDGLQLFRRIAASSLTAGGLIDRRLPNPDYEAAQRLTEVLSGGFKAEAPSLSSQIGKYLPEIRSDARERLACGEQRALELMRETGILEHVLRNAWQKHLNWMRILGAPLLNRAAENSAAKIVWQGGISRDEVFFLKALCEAGFDVALFGYGGEQAYRKADAGGICTALCASPGGKPVSAEPNLREWAQGVANSQSSSPSGIHLNLGQGFGMAREGTAPAGQASSASNAGAKPLPQLRLETTPPSQRASRRPITLHIGQESVTQSQAPSMQEAPSPYLNSAEEAQGIRTGDSPRSAQPMPYRIGAGTEQNPQSSVPAQQSAPREYHITLGGAGQRSGQTDGAVRRTALPFDVPDPGVGFCTNTFLRPYQGMEAVLLEPSLRQVDKSLVANVFLRVSGVRSKTTYLNELLDLRQKLKERRTVILDEITAPTYEEIASVRRGNYRTPADAARDLARNLTTAVPTELQKIFISAFLTVLGEKAAAQDARVNDIVNCSVYVLCWIRRYVKQLFSRWRLPDLGCLILLNGCADEKQSLFLRVMARTPTDVLILCPDSRKPCLLEDPLLAETHETETMPVDHYPADDGQLRITTAAYQAQRELDKTLYQDSGIYRSMQFNRTVTVTLNTTAEEAFQLWEQDLKYRTGFSTSGNQVTLPVIFAKFSGVRRRNMGAYWSSVKRMITKETYLIPKLPFLPANEPSPLRDAAPHFIQDGKLLREKIMNSGSYRYRLLRREMQEHLLDKLQLMLDQRLITGTFRNGMEYTIIATALNLNKELLRLIHQFDFARRNPKLLYVFAGEEPPTREDAIMACFLNLVGFDVALFVPSGYQSVEQWYSKPILMVHELGDYVYDAPVPDFSEISGSQLLDRLNGLIRKGR